MTTATQSLTSWLLDQIAADEAAARAASHDGDTWTTEGGFGWGAGAVETTTDSIVVYDEGRPSEAQAAHIARHDPAHVLAVCAAHRSIVEAHDDGKGADDSCTGQHDDYLAESVECPTLRALATAYADRPGWQEAWR